MIMRGNSPEKGVQTLNGEEALALARTRHIDSDAMRGQRQQLVIEAILKKKDVGSVTKVGNIIDDINGQFVTNLTFDDMLSFYKYGGFFIEKLQIQGEDCYMEKVMIHVANLLVVAEHITTTQIKRISKSYKRTSCSPLPAYTKTDSDSKKQIQRRQKNLSPKIRVNANQVIMT